MSAIHYTAFNGDLKLLKELVNYGGNLRQQNDTGISALQFAAQGNQAAVITYLLDVKGFDINESDNRKNSSVHWATYNHNELALSFLLARSPDVNLQDDSGITPLHLAVAQSEQIRSTSIVRLLLMKQANPFITERKGRTPLEYAKDKIKDEDWLKMITNLLEDVMDINKSCMQRVKGAFKLEQPVHKIRRSRRTMFGFFGTMIMCHLFLMVLIFPYMIRPQE